MRVGFSTDRQERSGNSYVPKRHNVLVEYQFVSPIFVEDLLHMATHVHPHLVAFDHREAMLWPGVLVEQS
jgi:hypothetical protein